jgi:hypothetical protein
MSEWLFGHRHKWKVIALATNFTTSGDRKSDPPTAKHLCEFQTCTKCNSRRLEILHNAADNMNFHANRHDGIQKVKALWEGGGVIHPEVTVTYYDTAYAQNYGIDQWISQLKNDPTMKKLIEQNSSVSDAVDNLHVVTKLVS